MAINQLLRAARKRKHWSQSQAAEKCGVDLQTFYRWEHGLQAPHGFNLDHMCDAFDVPMESLGYVTQTETATQPTAQNSPLLTLAPEQIAVLLPLLEGGTMDQKKRNTLRAILVAAGATVTAPPALA